MSRCTAAVCRSIPCSVRIDDQAAAHGFTVNEHAESHLVAVGAGEFNRPRFSADSETRRDDVAPLSRTPGIGHPTPIPERRRTEHDRDIVALQGMHAKANPRMSTDLIRIDVPRMQRRCLGTRIELSLDGRNSKRWKRGPFAPAVDPPLGNGRMAYSRLFFCSHRSNLIKRRRRDYACHLGLSPGHRPAGPPIPNMGGPASFINCLYIQAARISTVVLLFLVYFFQALRPLLHMSFGQVAPPHAERHRRGDGC